MSLKLKGNTYVPNYNPGYEKTIKEVLLLYSFHVAALAININDRYRLSIVSYLQSNAVFAIQFTVNSHLTSCTLLTRWSVSVLKYACHVGFKAYKRRLAYSVMVGILTLYYVLLKSYITKLLKI